MPSETHDFTATMQFGTVSAVDEAGTQPARQNTDLRKHGNRLAADD